MSKVITYSSDAGQVNLTRAQERMLRASEAWLKDRHGREMCDVHMGLHQGEPSYGDADLRRICGIEDAE